MKRGCWSTLWMNSLGIRNPEGLCSLRGLWSHPAMRTPTPSQWMLPAESSINSEVGWDLALGSPSRSCPAPPHPAPPRPTPMSGLAQGPLSLMTHHRTVLELLWQVMKSALIMVFKLASEWVCLVLGLIKTIYFMNETWLVITVRPRHLNITVLCLPQGIFLFRPLSFWHLLVTDNYNCGCVMPIFIR